MTSDFGSDIFDETQRSSPSAPKAEDAPGPDSAIAPAGGRSDTGEEGVQRAADDDRGSRRKRSRSRRKPRDPDATQDTGSAPAEQPEASESPAGPESQEDRNADDNGSGNDDERRSRRRGRRSRGGQGRHRDDRGDRGEDRGRRDRGGRTGRDRGDSRRGPNREDSRPVLNLPDRQRVAIFLDAGELQACAGDREISFGHLRRHITNARVPIRAIAYHPAKQKDLAKGLAHCGFEVSAVDSKAATNITIAIDAMALADRVDCIILVPGTKALAHLAKTLQARGVRVESASFDDTGDPKLGANEHLSVGAESCFVV